MADIGLLLSSPVLYLPDGQRTISIHIVIDDGTYQGLVSFLSGNSTKDPFALSHQLLADAFLIDYTDTMGWERVPKYSAILNTAQQRLEIEMHIENANQVVDLYNPEVHGGTLDIQWPAIRILLNNDSARYPFNFLCNIKMDRIIIKAAVTGSKAFKLYNNGGKVDSSKPFQPFGPVPRLGTYFEVNNTNIFNKYTRTFCLKIDWLYIPPEAGGFETYYRAYNNNINNNSFKIKISAANNAKFVPTAQYRQEFALFETIEDEKLCTTTYLQNIDVNRLEFSESPLLPLDDAAAAENPATGIVRVELTAPDDAFGNRIYLQIFSQIMIHNERHSKKLECPNQPYVPVMQGLSVDYVLEHSEALASGSAKEKTDIHLKVFHIFPLGFEKVYPAEKGGPYSFIPDFTLQA